MEQTAIDATAGRPDSPHHDSPGKDAWLMYAGRGTRDAARTIMAVLIGIFLVEGLGFSQSELGLLLGISLAGGLLLSFGLMFTGARLSRRASFVVLAAVTSLAGLLLLFTDNIWLLALGSFFGAYAASGMHVGPMIQLEQSGLAQVSRASHRTQAFSYLTLSSAAGRIAGGALVGIATFLIEARDFDLVDAHRIVFGVYIGLNLLTALFYGLLSPAVESQRGGPGEPERPTGLWNNPLKAKARGRILRISALFGVDSFSGGLVFDTFFAIWLFTQFGANEGTVGAVLVATQVANLVSIWLAPRVAARAGLLNTLVFTQVASNLCLLAFAFAPGIAVAVTLWVMRGLFDEMDVPTRQSYVMSIVPDGERDVMAATNNLGRGIGRLPSTTVTGALWSSSITVAPWVAAAGLKLAYNLAVYLSFRGVRPPDERGASDR
ncbi:MAG: MFS transporter [Chloroflexi bacterium]|nr:MFS transporter [Chloroflexota bacterium]